MRHQALHALLKLREYALEKEEQKLGERTREENLKSGECERSRADLHMSYQHTVTEAKTADYLRRDKCVREAGNRHITDLRQLALVQKARQAQVQNTLQAKQRADMIQKVLDHRAAEEQVEQDGKERKQLDDITQNLFIFNRQNG